MPKTAEEPKAGGKEAPDQRAQREEAGPTKKGLFEIVSKSTKRPAHDGTMGPTSLGSAPVLTNAIRTPSLQMTGTGREG